MTSNEIAERDQDAGTLAVFPPAQPHSSTAVAMLHEHAEVYNTAWKLAGQLVQTSMVPKRFFGKQGDATAAILYGAELGLNPIQSLQRVVPIHGMPSLEARTMVGLLKSRGYKVRTLEQSDTSVTVEGEAPDGETYRSTWTIDRAKQAGYVPIPAPGVKNPRPDEKDDWVTTTKTWNGKTTTSIVGNMKYITDPQTMLKAKAQAEVCRELAPEVLMGISYTSEELQSERDDQFDDRGPAAPTRARTSAPVTVDEIMAEEVPVPEPAKPIWSDDAERYAEQNLSGADAVAYLNAQRPPTADEPDNGYVAPQTPAGDVTEDQGDGAPDPGEPSPAEQPQTVADAVATGDPEIDAAFEAMEAVKQSVKEVAKQAATDQAAAKTSKKVAASRSTAPKANPDKPKSAMRKALEKRLFSLLGDVGLADEKNRDGRLAVYRSILERDDVTSTDDLDNPAVTKVADTLYQWSEAKTLDEKVAEILSDAVLDEAQSAATAADPTSEGND